MIVPISLYTIESVSTRSQDLCVSQAARTGTLKAFAIRATCAVPTLDITAPFAKIACAPRNTLVTYIFKIKYCNSLCIQILN